MGSRSDFSKGSISKNILSLALPMTAAQLVNVLYSVVDRIYLGRLPGSSHLALTGLGVTIPIVSIIMGFANLCGTGGGPIFSICRGQGDQEEAERVMGNSFSLLLILGAACTAFFLAFKRPILYLFGASDATFPYADDYMTIYLMGTLFVMISLGMNPFVNAQGFGSVGMMTVVLGAAVNIVLDPIFIFLLDMGVKGAALATVIGQAISCLTALVFSLRHRADLGLLPRYLRPEAEMVKRTLKLGFPVALQWTIASISWLVVLTLINKYGVTVSAGNGVSNKIRDFCQLFLSALTTGAGTMCAQCLGAGLYDRAEQVMKTCMKLALAMAAVIIVVAEVFAPQFAMIFTPDPEVQHWAVVNLRIEIVCQLFYAGMFTYNTLATGSGHTVFIMWNSFLNCIVVRLILAVVLEPFLGIYGVYIACGVAVASSVPVGWWFYRSKRWMTMKNIH